MFSGGDSVIQACQRLNNELRGCATGDRPLITFKFSLLPFVSVAISDEVIQVNVMLLMLLPRNFIYICVCCVCAHM